MSSRSRVDDRHGDFAIIPIFNVLGGGDFPDTEALLDALNPKIACISVGSNRYGHPAEDALQRLAAQGCAVYRTDQQGHIHIALDP